MDFEEDECPCTYCDRLEDWCQVDCYEYHDWIGFEDDEWDPNDI